MQTDYLSAQRERNDQHLDRNFHEPTTISVIRYNGSLHVGSVMAVGDLTIKGNHISEANKSLVLVQFRYAPYSQHKEKNLTSVR